MHRPHPGIWGPIWAARDTTVAAGVVTAEEVESWRVGLEARDVLSVVPTRFFPVFIAIGRRPLS